MMSAAYLFRQLRDKETDYEKRTLYDALTRLAQNVEDLGRTLQNIENRITQRR